MSAARVLRWQVPVDDDEHELLLAGEVLTVATTRDMSDWSVEFWTVEAASTTPRPRFFRVFGTGQPIPDGWVWRGTADRLHGLVWHLLERVDDEAAAGPRVVLEINVGNEDGADASAELLAAIRRAVRTRGGGDVQAVLG